MCCFVLVLGFLGPRIAFLVYWLAYPTKTMLAFNDAWIVPVLGVILLAVDVTGVGAAVADRGLLMDPHRRRLRTRYRHLLR